MSPDSAYINRLSVPHYKYDRILTPAERTTYEWMDELHTAQLAVVPQNVSSIVVYQSPSPNTASRKEGSPSPFCWIYQSSLIDQKSGSLHAHEQTYLTARRNTSSSNPSARIEDQAASCCPASCHQALRSWNTEEGPSLMHQSLTLKPNSRIRVRSLEASKGLRKKQEPYKRYQCVGSRL